MKIDKLAPNQKILVELGRRLMKLRKQQGQTQDQLAREAGIGVATLGRIEDGQDAQLSSWLKILKVLNMTSAIDDLVPESFNSPMSEVLRKNKGSKVTEKSATAKIWADEKR